jgi:hypothetical protein
MKLNKKRFRRFTIGRFVVVQLLKHFGDIRVSSPRENPIITQTN